MFTPLAKRLLKAGAPLGFNGLITIRGRKTGLPRTNPVAIIEVDGRRWVWAPWGGSQWVHNLRAAGRATITVRRRAAGGPRDRARRRRSASRSFATLWARSRGACRSAMWFIRTVDRTDLDDPVGAAEGRAVFELVPAQLTGSAYWARRG